MELPVPMLADGHGDSCLDLTTQVLYEMGDDPDLDSDLNEIDWLASMARGQHEMSHWVRYHGTSVGHLLNLLRHSRHVTATSALREAGPEAAPAIRMKRQRGVPLWSIEQPYDPSVAGAGFAIMGQAWVDSYWLWNALFDMSPLSRIRSHAEESAPYGLADAWFHSEGAFGNADYPGHELARTWLRGPIFARTTQHGELTTRLLWECASTLDELLPPELEDWDSRLPVQEVVLGLASWSKAHQKLAQIKLTDTAYGTPARVASEFCSELSILALLLLIDFALNPPLPMLGAAQGGVAWADFYPPERFLRCARHSQTLTAFTSQWQDDLTDLNSAYNLLSQLTGLAYFSPIDVPLTRVPSVRQSIDGSHGFHNSLVSTSSKLLWLRTESPVSVIIPHSSQRVPKIPGFDDDPPATLPLVLQLGVHGAMALMPFGKPEVDAFVLSAVRSHSLDWIANEVGPIAMRMPREYSLESLHTEVLRALAATIEWPENILRDCLSVRGPT